MDQTPSPPPPPDPPDVGGLPPIASSDFVLGYPEVQPPDVDLGPVPSGVGAKPSAKTAGAKPKRPEQPKSMPKPIVRSGPPLPKRAKGRLFIGSLFVAVLVAFGYSLFNSMLRYSAYGEVIGRRIELAVPWPGIVQSLHIREGDQVESGQLIALIDSLELRQKIEGIDDSLRLERARLASELAMLRWEAEKIRDMRQLSLSSFYEKWSELLWEQSRLADLRMQVQRLEPIYREGAATAERFESLRFQVAGQEKRVEQLTEAVRALKHRTDQSPVELSLEDRVKPTFARIENLQAELQRTREIIGQGEIRAPAAGRIIRTHRFVGEFADHTTPVAELLVEGSLEMVLFLPQTEVMDFPIGRSVRLHVSALDAGLRCEVQRVGLETQIAPDALARYYRPNESLFPVHLRIAATESKPPWLALGSEVRLPRSEDISAMSRLRDWWSGEPPMEATEVLRPTGSSEPVSPTQMARRRSSGEASAEKRLIGHDGRTAGWTHQP